MLDSDVTNTTGRHLHLVVTAPARRAGKMGHSYEMSALIQRSHRLWYMDFFAADPSDGEFLTCGNLSKSQFMPYERANARITRRTWMDFTIIVWGDYITSNACSS